VASEEPPYPSAPRAWCAVVLLLLLYVLSFVDRQVINLMVAPIRAEFAIGDFGASLLMGFGFAVFYTFFGIPIARLADTRSRRAIVAAGLAVWSAMTAACGFARTYTQLILARMGVGVGEAALSPSAYSSIADAFPPQRRGAAMGVYSMGSYLGSGLAFLLGGYLIGFVGEDRLHEIPLVGTVHSWQLVFLLVGLPGLLLLPLLATIPEPFRRGGRGLRGSGAVSSREAWRYLRENKAAFLCHNLGFALLAFSGYGSGAWTPTFLQRNHGMSAAESGIALGWIMTLAGTLGIVFGGWLADRLAAGGRRDAMMRVGLIASLVWIPAGVLYPIVEDRSLALALMVPALFTSGMPWGAAAAAVQEMTPNPMRAQATAVYLFVISLIGLGIGPSAVAFLTDYVFRDDLAVRWSLMWVSLAAHVGAALFLRSGLRPFVRSLDRCKQWSEVSAPR
jgi:MFS family permease